LTLADPDSLQLGASINSIRHEVMVVICSNGLSPQQIKKLLTLADPDSLQLGASINSIILALGKRQFTLANNPYSLLEIVHNNEAVWLFLKGSEL
jgi:hypothetical protein